MRGRQSAVSATLCSAVLVLGTTCWWGHAQETAPTSGPGELDAEAFLDAASAFAVAYNKGDAKAIAQLFAPSGEMIDSSGNVFQGREALEAEFAAYFELNPGSQIEIAVAELRTVSPGVVIEEGTSTITSADEASISTSRYTVVHVKQGEQWLMGSVRVLEDRPLQPHDRLQALAWLIGDWVDQGEDSTVSTSTRWSDDGNYILGRFEVTIEDRGVVKGEQRIGWDPLSKQFKSWVFDSEGGYSEGLWSLIDDEWVVKAQGVRPDGTVVTSTNIYTPLNEDSFGLRGVNRIAGGEALADFVATVVRRPPQAQTTQTQN